MSTEKLNRHRKKLAGLVLGSAEDWVFGPDPIVEENIYRCLPQVNLHGMDEELTMKLNLVILRHALAEVLGTVVYACCECSFFTFIFYVHFLRSFFTII
jgi:hypothetical protein